MLLHRQFYSLSHVNTPQCIAPTCHRLPDPFFVRLFQTRSGTCHYLGGGGTIWGERVIIFPSCLWEGHNFFHGFLGEGHIFFNCFFIEKIKYRYPACCSWFSLLTYFAPSINEKISRRHVLLPFNFDRRK